MWALGVGRREGGAAGGAKALRYYESGPQYPVQKKKQRFACADTEKLKHAFFNIYRPHGHTHVLMSGALGPLPPAPQGKTVHQSFSIISSFSQRVKLLHIRSLSDDKRFFYRRLKTSRDELEPRRKSKVCLSVCLSV